MKKQTVQPTGRVFRKDRGSCEFVPVDAVDKTHTSPAACGEDGWFATERPTKKPASRLPVFVNEAQPSKDCSQVRFRTRPHRFPSLCR